MSVMEGNWRRSLEAVLLWVIPLGIICAMVAHRPDQRTVVPIYHAASANWVEQQPIYIGPLGMNYLPHFAVIFAPFQALGVPAGDLCWRIAITALFVYSFYRLVNLCRTGDRHRNFLLATVFAMPMCLGAIRNGQANVLLGAVFTLAAVFLIERRWNAGALTMVAAIAVKPLGAVMLMLAPFGYRRMIPRIAFAIAAVLAFPFLFGSPEYVASQYLAFRQNLAACSTHGTILRFSNVYAIFSELSLQMTRDQMTFIGLGAASATLAAWIAVSKRGRTMTLHLVSNTETDREAFERIDFDRHRGVMLLALTTAYLMLFNPMAESNGYVILAPALAAVAVQWINDEQHLRRGKFLGGMMITMGILPEILRRIDPQFATWWKPLSAAIFIGMLLRTALAQSQAGQADVEKESEINRAAA